jgi:hypothetical protein
MNKIEHTLANPVTVHGDRNVRNEIFCSQLSTYVEDTWDFEARGIEARGFETLLIAVGGTDIARENFEDWLGVHEGRLLFSATCLLVLFKYRL